MARVGAVAATAAFAAMAVLAGPASAQTTSDITVTPATVQTSAQFATSGAMAYTGDAGVITVSIPDNNTDGIFSPSSPVYFEECNNHPKSQANCDGGTLSNNDTSGNLVYTDASGGVTFTMDLWILPTGNAATTPDVNDPNNTNPNGFDHLSTVNCNSTTPCAIWVGPDPTDFSNGYAFSNLTPLPNTIPLPATTTTTGATSSTTGATTSTTGATSSTTGATTSTTGATSSTTGATTSSTGATTSTTQPSGGQVPESPLVPLLPVGGLGLAGGGLVAYRLRHRRTNS